mmetsp:Transcript_29133/g.61957  ORF Transcript_29133/g.61957 Transcript_29133/m.61957 type:complete len:356 (+) Transcript_29133:71-1138(+)
MSNLNPTSLTITISFQPIKIKLFRSKKKSLLVIEGTCINGSFNRVRPGNKALVHIRPSSALPETIDDIECVVNTLLMDEEESRPHLNKGCWVNVDTTKRVVIKAHANMERNRRGDRLVECTDFLAVQDKGDESYLPTNTNNEYNEYSILHEKSDSISNPINLKSERHTIFAHWLIDTYGKERLSRGSGVMDVAGGNGMISRTLTDMGVPSTLLDPNPRCNTPCGTNDCNDGGKQPFAVIAHALNGDGSDLTSRDDDVGHAINNCSLLCGLHPDQATEPIVTLALRLNVPFAIAPCCVMPSLFPNRVQRRFNHDPVRSYSSFCQYLLDMAPSEKEEDEFVVDYLPFVGRNKVIYRK